MKNLFKGAALTLAACASLVALPSAAHADEGGTNGWARLDVVGSGTWVERVEVRTNRWSVLSFDGHFRIWGHGFDVSTRDQRNSWTLIHYVTVKRHLPQGSQICTEAFGKEANGHSRRGLPCVNVPV